MAHDDIIPSDDFPHEYTDEIVCPYCGYEFTDSWEYSDTQDEQKVDCHDCGEEFLLYMHLTVDYSTYKKKQ
jgi:DNA-directed RNA polymerase subunit RPC12/RpoP